MQRPNIILTGFMATGKSSTGRVLARKLGYEFVDTDQLIELRQRRTIADIFTDQGEAAFRRMEADIVDELSTREGLVIATGGGLMLDASNAKKLGDSGKVFCLAASKAEILKRLSSKTARKRRPLLANCDLDAHISNLLIERGPAYQDFDQIDTTGKKPYQVAAILARRVKQSS